MKNRAKNYLSPILKSALAVIKRELRKWYGHAEERFDEFARRYHDELTRPPGLEALDRLREQIGGGDAVLLTATKVLAYSHASVLREVLAAP